LGAKTNILESSYLEDQETDEIPYIWRKIDREDRKGRAVIERGRTSETSLYFNENTRRYIAENCHIFTRHRENQKFRSHLEIRDQRC
jgi:hypothetical protein